MRRGAENERTAQKVRRRIENERVRKKYGEEVKMRENAKSEERERERESAKGEERSAAVRETQIILNDLRCRKSWGPVVVARGRTAAALGRRDPAGVWTTTIVMTDTVATTDATRMIFSRCIDANGGQSTKLRAP